MGIQAGDIAPDFEQDTINGSIRFHEWMGRSWCILFCQSQLGKSRTGTGEMAEIARLKPEWNRRGVKVVGLAVDPVVGANDGSGDGWTLNFPVIADADGTVSALYGEPTSSAELLPRRIYVIDPDKKVRLVRTFPSGTRCDFQELLRMVECLQLADAPSGGGLRN